MSASELDFEMSDFDMEIEALTPTNGSTSTADCITFNAGAELMQMWAYSIQMQACLTQMQAH